MLSALNPELAYDQSWWRTVLILASRRLRDEQVARGKETVFAALMPYLDGAEPGEYAELGRRLGMAEGNVAVTIHRLRARLRELIRSEVLQTVASSEQADEEMRHLMGVWRR